MLADFRSSTCLLRLHKKHQQLPRYWILNILTNLRREPIFEIDVEILSLDDTADCDKVAIEVNVTTVKI